MNKILWGLCFLFFEIILETGFHIASGLVRGLSIKNLFIYGFLLLLLKRKFSGRKSIVLKDVKSIGNIYIGYIIFCAAIMLVVILFPPPGYDWLLGLGRLKSDLLDPAICFFVFLFFTDSLKKCEKMLTMLTLIVGIAAFATVFDTVVSSISLFGLDGDSNRPNGAFGEPNQSAAVFAFVFPFILARIFVKGGMRLLYVGIAVIILAAIASTGSRGGLLGASVGTLLFLWYGRSQLSLGNKLTTIIAAPILLFSAWLLMPEYYQELLISRLAFFGADTIDYSSASAGRTDIWAYALSFWFERPIFGWGWAGYQVVGGHATHSIYLERLADTGLVGFVIFMTIQYKIWKSIVIGRKAVNSKAKMYLGGMAAGLIGLYVALIFVNLYIPAIITWSFTGVMVSYANQVKINSIQQRGALEQSRAQHAISS